MVSLHPMPLRPVLDELKEQALVPEGLIQSDCSSVPSRDKASHCPVRIIALT